MDQKKIGEFILENRKKKKLTQTELAKRLKVSNHTISNWENGKSMPSYELLIPLTKELDISIPELINGEFESKLEEPNKVVEKTIKFLKHIDEDKKKKNRIIGTIIIIIGFLIKILSMILIDHYWWYDTDYAILAFIIILIGISYIYQNENIKKLFYKIFVGGIICLAIFTAIDISEIKIKNIPPRYYSYNGQNNHTLVYYKTPFYDAYVCLDDVIHQNVITDYTVVPKNYCLSMDELEEKYCKNK